MTVWTKEQESARQTLIVAVNDWRMAVCPTPNQEDGVCIGDSHDMECPVERARQDVIASHNKVEMLKAV